MKTLETTSLIHKTNKIVKGEHIFVTIELADECKNGHQDFSITADIYQAGKPKTDRYYIVGGCCHEEILKAFPEFKIFVDLHLCDYLGAPMHAVSNMYYHIRKGFNQTPVNDNKFKDEFCNYYRIQGDDFDTLNTAHSETHFAILLGGLGIPAQWEAQAKEGIKILEQLTGDTFVVDSVKTQLNMPSPEKLKAEQEKIDGDYYSPESVAEREAQAKAQAKAKRVGDMREKAEKKIAEIRRELQIKERIFEVGGARLLDNVIYYTHSNTIAFNWRSYGDRIEQEEAIDYIKNLNLDVDYKVN